MSKNEHLAEISYSYVYSSLRAKDIAKALGLFHADNLLVEVTGIESNSPFIENLQDQKIDYVSYQTLSSGSHTDVILSANTGDSLVDTLDKIIKSTPKQLSLYDTDFSLRQFLLCASDADYLIQSMIASHIINIDFGSNTLYIYSGSEPSFVSEVFSEPGNTFQRENGLSFRWSYSCGKTRSISALDTLKLFQVEKRRHARELNASYVVDTDAPVLASVLMELLGLFHADKLILEITGLETDGSIFKVMSANDIQHLAYPDPLLGIQNHTRVFVSSSFDNSFADLLAEIIKCNPGYFTLHLTDLSLEQFLYAKRTMHNLEVVKPRNAACVITTVLDESYIEVTFDTDSFSKSELVPEIKYVFDRNG